MSWIIHLITFGLPIVSSLRSQNRLLREHPRQQFEWLLNVLLVAYVSYLCICIFNPPTNFLNDLNCDANSPNYALRNAFRTHMSTHYNWIEGQESSAKDVKTKEVLYKRLLSKSERKIYLLVGHEAFSECSWCKDETDFLIYAAPKVLFKYFQFLIIAGLASLLRRKSFWKMISVTIVAILIILEILLFRFGFTEVLALMHYLQESQLSTFNDMNQLRLYTLAILSVLVGSINRKDIWTESEKMESILLNASNVFDRRTAMELSRLAVLDSKKLRKRNFEFRESQSRERKLALKGMFEVI